MIPPADPFPPPPWHTLNAEEVCKRLQSVPCGLSDAEAASRLAVYGLNELQAQARMTAWLLLVAQLRNVMIITLLAASGLSAILGHGRRVERLIPPRGNVIFRN